jgi:hypothetical protein
MRTLLAARHSAQYQNAHSRIADDAPLTREERRRITLASLEIMERRHRLRLAQIEAEKRSLLAGERGEP